MTATAPLTFHVPPDAGPDQVLALVSALDEGDGPLPAAALRARAGELLGKQSRGEALALLRDLDLIRQDGNVSFTKRGQALAAAPEVVDLIHGLANFAWQPLHPARLSRLWTYRTVVDLLWEHAPVTVAPAWKKLLVEDLLSRAEGVFGGEPGFSSARASLGPKSIDGVLRWLERLAPAVVSDGVVVRRRRCPPPLMVLALACVARAAGAEPGTDFRLGPEERDALARGCFLEPFALEEMLTWTVQTAPGRVRWGATNARYGRQIVLIESASPV